MRTPNSYKSKSQRDTSPKAENSNKLLHVGFLTSSTGRKKLYQQILLSVLSKNESELTLGLPWIQPCLLLCNWDYRTFSCINAIRGLISSLTCTKIYVNNNRHKNKRQYKRSAQICLKLIKILCSENFCRFFRELAIVQEV